MISQRPNDRWHERAVGALDALSAHCGIVDSFTDAMGIKRVATPETKRALLLAMGIEVADEDDARKALENLQSAEAARNLPPVLVHYQTSQPLEIAVTGQSARGWRLTLESGEVKQGALGQATVPDVGNGGAAGRLLILTELPFGYHTLTLDGDDARCLLVVTPGTCWLPPGLDAGRRLWGMAVQLYLLRSEGNWGIGDYGDLKSVVRTLDSRGADVIGLNPLHAMFPDDPEQASPYSPASRLLLNVLNIDVAEVAAGLHCTAAQMTMESSSFRDALARCRAASLVDYAGVAALKLPLLHELYWCCDRRGSDWKTFLAFRADAGAAFERTCLFLALRFNFVHQTPARADWHRWPDEYRSPNSPAVVAFGQVHAEAVTFQAWLQFVADQQLAACSQAASKMTIGLFRDLAVGAAAGGAETWANARAVVDGVHVGAPPDIHNPQGQNWGLPPFNPQALHAEAYQSFIELLRANMRHAGALRIDHVMALQQLYWVPEGRSAAQGGYIRYPLEDLVGILALESHRQQCVVVGEDLGTVPQGFRDRMERARVLSYRVLFFEKTDEEFIAPERYPPLALAVAGSHDLPTLRAWWEGRDLLLKNQLRLYPEQSLASHAVRARETDRSNLIHLMTQCGFIDGGFIDGGVLDTESFVAAAHRLLASTRCAITMLQLDDVLGEIEPVNVPTTSDEYPNWRRRLSASIERLAQDPRFISTTDALCTLRGN